jgi:phosphoglycerate dehydrogenase-like enzyme
VTKVLIHHDRPEECLAVIAAHEPALEIHCCRTYGELPAALEAFGPEVIYGVRFAGTPTFPRRAILDSPTARWMAVGGSGTDHLAPWNPTAFTVTNAAGVASASMAQYAIGAILSLTIGFPGFERDRQARRWDQRPIGGIDGKTVTIVGLGKTGCEVARRAKALGLGVVGVRARPRPTPNVDRVYGDADLHAALGAGDYVVLSVPLTASTRGFIDAAAFRAMRPGVILVDVSRGGVIEEAALFDAVGSGHVAGVALDVFEAEPLPPESPFWGLENAILTPHCSSLYDGWEGRSAEIFLDNLVRWRRGEPLENIVDPVRGY